MSTHSVPFTQVLALNPHPNPVVERLELARIYGYDVIVRKGQYKVGSLVFYIPIDSILPTDLEQQIFPEGSKIKLTKSRVKLIKLQGFPSLGLLIDESDVKKLMDIRGVINYTLQFELEKDYSEILNIKKFLPPEPEYKVKVGTLQKALRPKAHPQLHLYNGLEHFQKFTYLLEENDTVYISEKIHGCCGRFSLLPSMADTFWKKVKKFFGLLPAFEYRYGSNKVELTHKASSSNWYSDDVWGKAIKAAKLHTKIKPNEVIYGEVVFEGVQKNYSYGHTEPFFIVFDIKQFNEDSTWRWLNPDEVISICKERNIVMVPTLYTGPLKDANLLSLVSGNSVYCPKQKIREGVVIKKAEYNDERCSSRKAALKYISPDYAAKENSDFQ